MTAEGEEIEQKPTSGSIKSGKRLNIVLQCALKGDAARLQECFSNEDDPYFDRVESQINSNDEDGRSPVEIASIEGHIDILRLLVEKGSEVNVRNPKTSKTALDMACILGRDHIVKELLEKGAETDLATNRGYTALHHAAAWDRMSCVKLLIAFGASMHIETSNKEKAYDTALRFNRTTCANYLKWSEARRELVKLVTETKETIEDPQKVQGRLAKDDKMTGLNACSDIQEWLDNPDRKPSVQEFHRRKKDLEETLEPIMQKLSEPPPEKPHRR
ncbi:ankyrin repeat domain-containing protein 45-like isoform X2 [Amphiura filiformis]|uniref:ankyrin repeat domain-containing protein 45-like isoform X2 n=1 Tax=Amphiura filiformis TaxID=82378 RepID=UPI003B21D2BF